MKFTEIKKIERNKIDKKENITFNIEQIPGESMAVRLANLDYVLEYNCNYIGEQKEKKYELYSNQYIPLIDNASIYDRLRVQGEMDQLTSGGSILHLNVDDEKPINKEQFKNNLFCDKLCIF